MHGLSLKGMKTNIGLIVTGKLVVHPLVMAGLLLVLPISDPVMRQTAQMRAAYLAADSQDFAAMQHRFDAVGTIERAAHYGAMARDALEIFGPSPVKSALLQTVDFCISRAH